MAVRHADEGLDLQLLDYLLMAREATSVEIAEEAKGLGPLDKTLHLLLQIEEWVSYLVGAI